MTTQSVKQAMENINAIKEQLFKNLPGGEKNVKSIYLKSTDAPAVPIYVDSSTNLNEVKLANNVTAKKLKKQKRSKVKRLEKKAQKVEEKNKKAAAAKKRTLVNRGPAAKLKNVHVKNYIGNSKKTATADKTIQKPKNLIKKIKKVE